MEYAFQQLIINYMLGTIGGDPTYFHFSHH